jgi:3-phosphoshikimate 1-carboxyvinyltransferase
MDFKVKAGSKLTGEVQLPGDKSISHRSIMCAALAEGTSVINGFLEGEDCLATLDAFSKMGVSINRTDNKVVVQGVGLNGLKEPDSELYLGNSGTSMRLMSGILSGQKFPTVLTGDSSLSSRPMERIISPLKLMGSRISSSSEGTPPIEIQPSLGLSSLSYELPIASAQIKSCLMFAGLYTHSPITVIEQLQTRNHTELMFKKFGIEVEVKEDGDAREIKVIPPESFLATDINVPADFSSAAFFILAALITPESNLTLKNVGINPTRTALLEVLQGMGANIKLSNIIDEYEPSADLQIKFSKLKGIELDPKLIPNLIDELPVLFVAASLAEGKTKIRGAEELRAKESDRLEAMSNSLNKLGVSFDECPDGIDIQGLNQEFYSSNSNLPFKTAVINSFDDHRIAMASAIACTRAPNQSKVEDVDNVITSFPNFLDTCRRIGMEIDNT